MIGDRRVRGLRLALLVSAALALGPSAAGAEYGDVVLNRRSEAEGVRPVIFPHWFHRIRFRCKVCHEDLGIVLRAGANRLSMQKILDGEQCGLCHGAVAFPLTECNRCHSVSNAALQRGGSGNVSR